MKNDDHDAFGAIIAMLLQKKTLPPTIEDIVADPIEVARDHDCLPHPRIPRPADIFEPERPNSKGLNLADRNVSRKLLADMEAFRN